MMSVMSDAVTRIASTMSTTPHRGNLVYELAVCALKINEDMSVSRYIVYSCTLFTTCSREILMIMIFILTIIAMLNPTQIRAYEPG